MTDFVRRIGRAETFWAATRELLTEWRSRRPTDGGGRGSNGWSYDHWSMLSDEVAQVFRWRTLPILNPVDQQRILRWTKGGTDINAVDAVAWGIDRAAATTFPASWRNEVGAASGEHQMIPGELYPVSDIPEELFPGEPITSQPASLTRAGKLELPHVRAFADQGIDVVVDFNHEAELEAVAAALRTVAAVHLNHRKDEFDFDRSSPQVVFPIAVRDGIEQTQRAVSEVRRALLAGAQVIVLPELSSAPEIISALEDLLKDAVRQCLVVAGSFHSGAGATACNVSIGLTPEAPIPLRHEKIVPFTDELRLRQPWKEGIAERERPALRIYAVDRFRICLLICKDFLDDRVTRVVTGMGGNLVCVPAMSEKTTPFRRRTARYVDDAQAITIVANAPLDWGGRSGLVLPAAVFGQPIEGSEVLESPADGKRFEAPAISLLELGAREAVVL